MTKPPRTTGTKDLLSGVHPSEIVWDIVAPYLRGETQGSFVYAIVEQHPDPAIKIGFATDPIKRLRQLQTGNPRRLKLESLIIGDMKTERLLHAFLHKHVIGGKKGPSSQFNAAYIRETEWFSADAYEDIMDAMAQIAGLQRERATDNAITTEETNIIIAEVMADLGYEIVKQDAIRLLAQTVGYVQHKRRQ